MKTTYPVILLTIVGLFLCCEGKKVNNDELRIENRVIDHADILTTGQEDSIFTLIENLDLNIGSQVAVLTIDSLGGQRIEEFSIKFVDKLDLGRPTHRDGQLIIVAHNDRKIRIEVGIGLENIIGDEVAARLITEELAPKFREGKFGKGLYIVTEKIVKLIEDNKEKVRQDPVWK